MESSAPEPPFGALARLLAAAREAGAPAPAVEDAFAALRLQHALATARAAHKIACRVQADSGRRELARVLSAHDFTGELQRLGEQLAARLSGSGRRRTPRESALQALAEAARRLEPPDPAAPASSEAMLCPDCGVALAVDSQRAEACCPECRCLVEMHGVAYEDAQLRSMEGQRSKSGRFKPNTHCQAWMTRVQALEPESEIGDPSDPENYSGEKLIRALAAHAQRSNKLLPMLTIEDVRALLRAEGRTDLNHNAALILSRLTNCRPPVLSDERRQRADMMFTMANSARTALNLHNSNRSYYPYYLFKIFDLILPPMDPDRLLLCYIHLQSAHTIANNDGEWKKICQHLGWEWRATDVTQVAVYRSRFGGRAARR